jgi:prepilin-type N-terminal cleavage/methylation domain-containing protein
MCRNAYTTGISRTDGFKTAFTLIELMIVIVIIGIAAAMAVPMISSAASFQIRSGANMVAADLEYAKSMAISHGRPYAVAFHFDSAVSSYYYQIEDPNGTVIAPPGRQSVVRFGSGSQLNNVLVTSVTFGGSETVTFDYLGSPQGLSSQGVVRLEAGGIVKTVTVEPVTGFISVSN